MLKPLLIGLGTILVLESAAILLYAKVFVPRQNYIDVLSYQNARQSYPDFPYPELDESEKNNAQVYVTKNKYSGQSCEAICFFYSDQKGTRYYITREYGKNSLTEWKEENTVLVDGKNIQTHWEEKGTAWDPDGLYYHCTIQHFYEGNCYQLTSIASAKQDLTPQKNTYVKSLLKLLPDE